MATLGLRVRVRLLNHMILSLVLFLHIFCITLISLISLNLFKIRLSLCPSSHFLNSSFHSLLGSLSFFLHLFISLLLQFNFSLFHIQSSLVNKLLLSLFCFLNHFKPFLKELIYQISGILQECQTTFTSLILFCRLNAINFEG